MKNGAFQGTKRCFDSSEITQLCTASWMAAALCVFLAFSGWGPNPNQRRGENPRVFWTKHIQNAWCFFFSRKPNLKKNGESNWKSSSQIGMNIKKCLSCYHLISITGCVPFKVNGGNLGPTAPTNSTKKIQPKALTTNCSTSWTIALSSGKHQFFWYGFPIRYKSARGCLRVIFVSII